MHAPMIVAIALALASMQSTKAASDEARLARQSERYFGVAASRSERLYRVTTLSKLGPNGLPDSVAKPPPSTTKVFSGTHGAWSLEIFDAAIAARPPLPDGSDTPQKMQAASLMASADADTLLSRFAETAEAIFSESGVELPKLRVNVYLVEPDDSSRYLIEDSSTDEIPINLVVARPATADGAAKAGKRMIIEALAGAAHEYFHALVDTGSFRPFKDQVSEETAASIIDYATGFLTAGCSASGTISLDGGAPITVPVELKRYEKRLRPYRDAPSLEGYGRAMLNIANALGQAQFMASEPGVRRTFVAIARSAAHEPLDYRKQLLPLSDRFAAAKSATADECGTIP